MGRPAFFRGFADELRKDAALPIMSISAFPGVARLRSAARIGKDVGKTISLSTRKALKEPWVK